jgi:hypothetical protein
VITPGGVIALRTAAGKKVKKLKAGDYVLQVRDRSARCGLRLRNGGVSRRTGIAFTGRISWSVTIGPGVLTLRCGKRGVSVPVA